MSSANGHRPALEAEHLELHFAVRKGLLGRESAGAVRAVDDLTLDLREGETLGLVGESGCGKSTLARALVRLLEPTAGSLRFRGQEVAHAPRRQLAPLRREVAMVFQDPYSSLNPRKRVGRIVALPLAVRGVGREEADARARDLLARVGLEPDHADRHPHELSGGQRQRVGIARALAGEPRLLVLDEPVSALDASLRDQITGLLAELQAELGLGMLLIAHDLELVRRVARRVAVMYLGKLMEVSPAEALHVKPVHPYTAALLAAAPIADPKQRGRRDRLVLPGEPPNPMAPPPGCVFHPRCPRATDVCRKVEPPLMRYPDGRTAACHHPLNVTGEDLTKAERSDSSPLSASEEMPGAT